MIEINVMFKEMNACTYIVYFSQNHKTHSTGRTILNFDFKNILRLAFKCEFISEFAILILNLIYQKYLNF